MVGSISAELHLLGESFPGLVRCRRKKMERTSKTLVDMGFSSLQKESFHKHSLTFSSLSNPIDIMNQHGHCVRGTWLLRMTSVLVCEETKALGPLVQVNIVFRSWSDYPAREEHGLEQGLRDRTMNKEQVSNQGRPSD